MSHLIDERQIQHAIDAVGLSYVEDISLNLTAQLSIWLNAMLASPRNLTSITDPSATIRKHAIEPLQARHRLIDADLPIPHGIMLDIGSGNGSPGLPLALCEPHRPTILLDSRSAATSFLSHVIQSTDVSQVSVLQERAEVAAHADLRGRCAIVVSRAVAPPAVALELMIPFLKTGGVAVAMTGALSELTTTQVANAVAELGAVLTPVDPPADMVVATKIRPCSDRFPRPWNQIRRRPLGDG